MRPIDRYVYSPHAHKAAPRRALLLDITIATVTRPVIRPQRLPGALRVIAARTQPALPGARHGRTRALPSWAVPSHGCQLGGDLLTLASVRHAQQIRRGHIPARREQAL